MQEHPVNVGAFQSWRFNGNTAGLDYSSLRRPPVKENPMHALQPAYLLATVTLLNLGGCAISNQGAVDYRYHRPRRG